MEVEALEDGCRNGTKDSLAAGDASMNGKSVPKAEVAPSQNHPFLRAMQCDLVVEQLMKSLNFEDVKALSAVSKDCLAAVRKTKSFSNRAKFIIAREVIAEETLKECSFLWKHLTLDLSIPVVVLELIADILESVVTLSLRWPSNYANLSDSELCQYLEGILKKTKNLRELELNIEIFTKVLHDLFASVEIQPIISKLHALEIRGLPEKPHSSYYLQSSLDNDDDESESPFQRNFLQLSKLPLSLKKFALVKVVTFSDVEQEWMKFIPNIVETSSPTLENLELHYPIWTFEKMKAIRCPNLKRLVLSASSENGGDLNSSNRTNIETFIRNQPPLEELVFEMKGEFPVRLMLCLQGMLSRMKKLSLKVKRFSETSEPIDWRFLGRMDKLEEFYLRKPYAYDDDFTLFGRGEEIIENLPTSIKKISLIGIHPFWRDNDAQNDNIGTFLNGFKNLTELDLTRSNFTFTDDGLQSFIKNFPHLTALAFSHCPQVTDYGISGVRTFQREGHEIVENSGISLTDLKGLVRLKIRSCPNITPDGILNVVKFNYLRSFDYYKNVQLPKEFLFKIVRQNPCLEEVALHIGTYSNDQEYINEMKRVVKKINPRVHFIETLEQSNWEDEDSDTDADNDDGNDGDSDFSGGGYPDDRFGDHLDYDDDYNDSPDDYDEDGLDYDYDMN